MNTSVDDGQLYELIAESADMHADSMRVVKPGLSDYVTAVKDTASDNRRNLGRGAVLAGVAGAGVFAASRAYAAGDDVAILQTAASIENLAVATYGVALTLPFIGGSSALPVVKAFVTMTQKQHMDHAAAFNAAAKGLGGAEQTNPDPKYLAVVNAAKPTLTGPAAVLGLAIALEDVAAQTYTKDATLVSTATLRSQFVSVAAVEAQHKAILLAVQALVGANKLDLIKLGPDPSKLPKAAGSVGFPDAFYPVKKASPSTEGAVK